MTVLSSAPQPVEEYARFMTDVFDERQIIGVPTMFQAFFGRPETGARTVFTPDAAVVDIDIIRGNERLAKLKLRGVNSKVLDKPDTTAERYTALSRLYPLIEEEGNIDSNQLLSRRPGESPMNTATRLDRMRSLALGHHQEQVRRIVRLFEYLASQSVLTGKMPAIFGTSDSNLLYDFLRPAGHIITVSTPWDNGGSDPLADVDTACGLIRANGHAKADVMIIGSSAVGAFVNHATVKALADNRRFELVQVGREPVPPKFQRFVDAGAIPRGRFQTPAGNELWLFTYLDVYTNDAGTATPYMPVDECLIAASSARCDRYFGPPEKLPSISMDDQLYQEYFGFAPGLAPMPPNIKDAGRAISPAMFYFDAYRGGDNKRVTCRTQAAPIFATTQTDAFVTLNGLMT